MVVSVSTVVLTPSPTLTTSFAAAFAKSVILFVPVVDRFPKSLFAALSIALRVSASKPMLTTPLAAVEIAIPFLVASPFVVVEPVPVAFTVPVPALKVKPVVTATVFDVASSPAL